MRGDKIPAIKQAHEAMRLACEAYSDAVLAEFPVGSTVYLERGDKQIGPYFVDGVSGAWRTYPGRLVLKNPRTGKVRHAGPSQVYMVQGGKCDE